MAPKFHLEDSQLIDALHSLSKKSPKLVRGSDAAVPFHEDHTVRSWKLNEFKYYVVPSPFPTLARGLFTTTVKEGDAEEYGVDVEEGVKHRIVIRGYDKFFNIGEVPWTTWENLQSHTSPPYILSLKSNGCIIFIAALTPSKLIVTSKHSVGAGDENTSHAMRGRMWLNKYLKERGRTEADLAAALWEKQWTAVAELCDDSFEEHVLPYPPEQTGLHLHGLNVCSRHFITEPTTTVDAFAAEWGFIRTPTLSLPSIKAVKEFTEECSKTGTWNGEAVEGFVVRTTTSSSSPPAGSKKTSPYEPNSSFFFKIKFDEPYMMYRDWREVTKALLSMRAKHGEQGMKASALPKGKMRREETRRFVEWVIKDIQRNPGEYEGYMRNKGIIRSRERYLRWVEEGGVGEIQTVGGLGKEEGGDGKEWGKTVIVPVAIPGCGKTTVSLALSKLFGWGHTQSDDVQAKKAAPVFIKNVTKLLTGEAEQEERVKARKAEKVKEKERKGKGKARKRGSEEEAAEAAEVNEEGSEVKKEEELGEQERITKYGYDVVIADKNNHLKRHRADLRAALSSLRSPLPTRMVALYWDILTKPPAMVHRICSDRILGRGEKHQTLVPEEGSKSHHEEVVWMFVSGAEELGGDEVDDIIEMQINEHETVEDQVWRAVEGLCALDGLGPPIEVEVRDQDGKVVVGEDGKVKKKVVRGRLEKPTRGQVREALEWVKKYEEEVGERRRAVGKGKGNNAKKQTAEATGGGKKKRKGGDELGNARYYAILPEFDVVEFVDGRIADLELKVAASGKGGDESVEKLKAFWKKLKDGKRVTKRPHVTIVHRNGLKEFSSSSSSSSDGQEGGDAGGAADSKEAQEKEGQRGVKLDGRTVWDMCNAVDQMLDPPVFEGVIRYAVWNERVMSLVFEDVGLLGSETVDADADTAPSSTAPASTSNVDAAAPSSTNVDADGLASSMADLSLSTSTARGSKTNTKLAKELVDGLPNDVKRRLHVTVGTRDGGVPPVEGRWVVEGWREGGSCVGGSGKGKEEVWCVEVGEVRVRGLLKGLVS
ncbi:RNA ligase [Coprinopsis cinerea okayama7|uniref:RNA ligase n=1 Tax=Coprinopsis cinerea (strain Okayama-7 / 130 / ATCC MYA-4618 / FGSC 9003) TaxID=240176 RepID=A8P4T2_COPC7|nr:RNA ligase [Coprinopsis cinerea okayama7\|eukprot:XP_001838806.1 RNA ligase [Coprinopsis cinerea okayama7\